MKDMRFFTILAILVIGILTLSSGIVYARRGGLSSNRGIRQYGQRLTNLNGETQRACSSQLPEVVQDSFIQKRVQKRETTQKRAAKGANLSQEPQE